MVALEVATIAIKATAKILEDVMDTETSLSPKKAKLSDPKTINSLSCSKNIATCEDKSICAKASVEVNMTRKWEERPFYSEFVAEAKKRNLSCGVALISSTTIASSNNDICFLATQGVGAEKRWRKVSSAFYQDVVEAKKRGLSCGVLSTSSTTKTDSVCSSTNLKVCSNKLLCSRGSRSVNDKRIWDERPNWIKYSVEAKKRNLSCGVKAISSTAKVVSPCSINNTEACNNNYVCQFATNGNAGKKAWYKKDQPLYRYVTEAKKRGLTCGVKVISSKTKTSSACSKTNTKTCTDYLLCRFSTITDAGKQVWFESDHIMYPYVIEAKKRNLSCGIKSSG